MFAMLMAFVGAMDYDLVECNRDSDCDTNGGKTQVCGTKTKEYGIKGDNKTYHKLCFGTDLCGSTEKPIDSEDEHYHYYCDFLPNTTRGEFSMFECGSDLCGSHWK